MAIRNPQTNEYIRINKEQLFKTLPLEEFKDQTHRQSGDTEFLKHKDIYLGMGDKLAKNMGTSFVNLVVKFAYLELKKNPEYTDWVDC